MKRKRKRSRYGGFRLHVDIERSWTVFTWLWFLTCVAIGIGVARLCSF